MKSKGDMHDVIHKHYTECSVRLMKRLYFRAGDVWSAEDVLQESYARALKYWGSFNGDNFEKWFNTIMNNSLREFKNMEKGYSAIEYDDELGEGTACPQYHARVMAQVYELIDTKSLVQIEVLTLYFQQEYTARDISHVTEYSYSQIHQIIQRFRNELKDLYG